MLWSGALRAWVAGTAGPRPPRRPRRRHSISSARSAPQHRTSRHMFFLSAPTGAGTRSGSCRQPVWQLTGRTTPAVATRRRTRAHLVGALALAIGARPSRFEGASSPATDRSGANRQGSPPVPRPRRPVGVTTARFRLGMAAHRAAEVGSSLARAGAEEAGAGQVATVGAWAGPGSPTVGSTWTTCSPPPARAVRRLLGRRVPRRREHAKAAPFLARCAPSCTRRPYGHTFASARERSWLSFAQEPQTTNRRKQ